MRHKDHILPSRLLLALIASMVGMSLPASEPAAQPRLVIGIMIDGLEQDYLDLLKGYFGEDGFRRLMDRGVVIPAVDYGSPLDATAATSMVMSGASPSVTGIASEYAYDREACRRTPVFADAAVLGNYTDQAYSPRSLKVSTLADEVRIAGGGVTSVYAIAADPSASIALGGHAANCAVWIDDRTGNWATSTFYTDVPTSVAMRNRLQPLAQRLDTLNWTPSLRSTDYPDLPDHLKHYPFRYTFGRGGDRYAMFKASPAANSEVTSLACDFITSLKLGAHDGVDMINVAYSLKPYNYSKNPDNRFELMDAYVKLDSDIARLINTASSGAAGKEGTVVFVAATPAGSGSRRDDERYNVPYGQFSARKAISLLNMYLMAIHGSGEWVNAYHNNHFYLNHKLIKERDADLRAMRVEASDFLMRMSGVANAFTIDDIMASRAGDNAAGLKRNTAVNTAGDIYVEVAPGWEITETDPSGAADRGPSKVYRAVAPAAPAFIFAPTLSPRVVATPVDARAIAPTVARILRIRSPNAASLPALSL